MRQARRNTFWRYNLFLEVSAQVVTSVALLAAVWFTLTQINQRYLDLRIADAARVHIFLENQLDEARTSLAAFADLPEVERGTAVVQILAAFSDIYELDRTLHVAHIHKAVTDSKVFVGFSFSRGKLADYLRSAGSPSDASEILRGYEDDAPSVYFLIRRGDRLLLGRLNLDYVQRFLNQFTQYSGTPLMLVASDGFVMLSGAPELGIAAFDLKKWSGPPNPRLTLDAGNRRWIPMISPKRTIGAWTAILIPTELLDSQRNTLIGLLVGFMGVLTLLVVLKNRRLNRLLLWPIAAFAERMRDLEQGQVPAWAQDGSERFTELADIHTRFQAMATAISQREQSLRESERKYRVLAESIKDVIWTLDTDTLRFLYVSPSVQGMRGFTPEEIIAAPADAAFTPEAAVAFRTLTQARAAALASGQAAPDQFYTDELEQPRKDGTRVWTEVITTYYRNDRSGRVEVHGVSRDIGDRKEAQAALILAKEQAESANRAKSAFLANMSHEIRTPLNAILGFAQVLARDTHLTDAQHDSLTTIRRSGEHLLNLINDVLDMAKIEAGWMTLRVAPFDLPRLLTETLAVFQQRAQDRQVDIRLMAPGLPRMVAGDGQKLRQVLINLVGNAVKFTPAGGITLRVEPGGIDQMRFSVSDTGIGIAEEELAGLCVPFNQTASGRGLSGGTGLGLALSNRFVRLMGGDLSTQSAPGQGSCFAFTLPLRTLDDTAAPAPDQGATPVIGLQAGQAVCRVLIVDDLVDNRRPLWALLASLNPEPPVLELREAGNGREAVEIWETWQPQVIFMDMRMPVMSGEAATRAIKTRMRERPGGVQSVVIALTANVFEEQRDQVLACGCDEFARIPFRAEELLAILERLAGLRFIRSQEPPPRPPGPSQLQLVEHLAAAPQGWRVALEEAVALGDFEHIGALVDQLGATDPVLHAALTRSAYDYDLDAFTSLLNRAEGRDNPMHSHEPEPDSRCASAPEDTPCES